MTQNNQVLHDKIGISLQKRTFLDPLDGPTIRKRNQNLRQQGVVGVLIPSLYAISLRTPSLRLVRIPSDQNTRWQLTVHILLIRDKNFLYLHIFQVDTISLRVDNHHDAAHVRHVLQDITHYSLIYRGKVYYSYVVIYINRKC